MDNLKYCARIKRILSNIRNDLLMRKDISDNGIPPGCAACGGPYPDCKPSCPVFDD